MARRALAPAALLSLCLAFATLPLLAQAPSAAEGHWEGAIELPGTALAVLVDLATKGGALGGAITIPAQGAKDLPLEAVKAEGATLSFAIGGIPGAPIFKGTVEGDSLKGTFTQGGAAFPFTLRRGPAPAAVAKDALADFAPVAEAALKTFEVPSVGVAVVKGGEVVYAKGFGLRDVEGALPATPDTLYAIGSCSKAFTTFLLATLVDEGKLEWDRPVKNYIPWFEMADPQVTLRITPRDLVTHRSGLPRHDLAWYNNQGAGREETVRKLKHFALSEDLRQRFQYNNLMFLTAGYLGETLTGQTWEEAVRARILDPLGMARTNFSVEASQKDADFAQPYEEREDKVTKVPFRPILCMGPAGSINSSASEMGRWVAMLLSGGKAGDKRLATPGTVQGLFLAQMPTGATPRDPAVTPADYAMGWMVDTYRGHRRVHHGGNIDGFSALVTLFPDDGVGVVVLANSGSTGLPENLSRTAADRVLGLEARDWLGEAAARRQKGKALEAEGKAKKGLMQVKGTKPAHPLADYAGVYDHPGYGPLEVTLDKGRLVATYTAIATPLDHWHYETFKGSKAQDPTFEDVTFTFVTDPKGRVAALQVPMEPAVEPIAFKRRVDMKWSDPAYLARFKGAYELGPQRLTVDVRGGALTLSVPGQPLLELVPDLGGLFGIKETSEISLRFVEDATGAVTGLELLQPQGLYTAKRAAK